MLVHHFTQIIGAGVSGGNAVATNTLLAQDRRENSAAGRSHDSLRHLRPPARNSGVSACYTGTRSARAKSGDTAIPGFRTSPDNGHAAADCRIDARIDARIDNGRRLRQTGMHVRSSRIDSDSRCGFDASRAGGACRPGWNSAVASCCLRLPATLTGALPSTLPRPLRNLFYFFWSQVLLHYASQL